MKQKISCKHQEFAETKLCFLVHSGIFSSFLVLVLLWLLLWNTCIYGLWTSWLFLNIKDKNCSCYCLLRVQRMFLQPCSQNRIFSSSKIRLACKRWDLYLQNWASYGSFCTPRWHEISISPNCQNPSLTSTQGLGSTRKWLYNHHPPTTQTQCQQYLRSYWPDFDQN